MQLSKADQTPRYEEEDEDEERVWPMKWSIVSFSEQAFVPGVSVGLFD